MFSFIKRLFGAGKDTAEAIIKPEVAKIVVAETEPKKPAAAKKKTTRARKPKAKA